MLGKELEEAIVHEFPALAKSLARELLNPSDPLKEQKSEAERIEQELHRSFDLFKKRCTEGIEACLTAVDKETATDLRQAFERFDSVDTVKKLEEQAREGKTWRELLHIKDSSLEVLYKGAQSIFDSEQYEKAEAAFSVLALLDSEQYHFWIGLGHSAFHAHHHEIAISAYMSASMIDPFSMWPHIFAANCFEREHDITRALMALEEAKQINDSSPDKDVEVSEELSQRCRVLKSRGEH